MLALIDLDGDADLPQNLLVNLADRRAQRPNRGRGIEIENRHEVLMLEILFRIQPTARHQGIGDTDGGGGLKLDFDVVIIVLRQERTVNDVADIPPVFLPIIFCQFPRHIYQLLNQSFPSGYAKLLLQHSRNLILMLWFQFPKIRIAGMFSGSRI